MWTKIGLLALLLVLFFSVGFFGSHFGYTVKGVPKGGDNIDIGDVAGYLWNLASFGIDDMPEALSIIFIIMVILFCVLLVTLFTPFLGGG
jgi:hypothetical protein